MIKTILVAVDGSPNSLSALRYGLEVAKKCGAEVDFLFVKDRRKTQMPYMYTGGAYDISYERIYIPPDPQLKAFYERINTDLEEYGQKVLEQCRNLAEEHGITSRGTVEEGFPADVIAEKGRSADLLLVGQRGENGEYKREMVGSTTEELVRRSVRPIMVCPEKSWTLDRILFPYDRSRSAENALRFYIDSFRPVASGLIMMVAEAADFSDALEEEKRFLHDHDVDPKMLFCDGSPVEEVLKAAESEKSDMIMIGSHGRNKIVDYILGSTTSHVLRKSAVPVLIVY